jgi:DNA-binding CsgD family transcriptional regulator
MSNVRWLFYCLYKGHIGGIMASSNDIQAEHEEYEATTDAINIVDGFVEAFSNSDSATAFCRAVVHGDFTPSGTVGCQLFWLDHQAELKIVASYGLVGEFDDYSTWAGTPLGDAVRARKIVVEPFDGSEDNLTISVLPFFSNGDVPVGAMVVWLRDYQEESLVLDSDQGPRLTKMLGSLGAFYLRTAGIGSWHGVIEAQVNGVGNGEELTERQRTILGYMAEGQTNAEIAKVLMLSESSIRQETVRIYRALGVKSRVEASKKGQALGLIAQRGLGLKL